MLVFRFDRSELRKPQRTREGWLRADGRLTRTGVFDYRKADGSVQRELRLPEEVFHKDAIESFALTPLTREHPKGPVTSSNWRSVAVGTVGETLKQDGDFIAGTLLFTDPDTIRDLEDGKRTELSCGYTCDLELKPGTWKDGAGAELHYDAIQRNIRGNHVALVTKGRAGPSVRVRLDATDAIDASLETTDAADDANSGANPGGGSMVRYKVDGVEYDVSEQAKQALEREQGKREVLDAKAKTDLETAAKARADAEAKAGELEKKLQESEKAREDGADPKKVQELVKARVTLETAAAPILGKEAKLDAMDDKAVKVAVLKKLVPGWKEDGKSDAAIDGAFEIAVSMKKAQPTPRATPVQQLRQVTNVTTDADEDPVATARTRMIQEARDAWKPPTAKSAA